MSNFIKVEREFCNSHGRRTLINTDCINFVEEISENKCAIDTDKHTFKVNESFDKINQMLSSRDVLKFENGKLTEVIPL